MTARTTLLSFISKSNSIHENKYDYSRVIYKNTHTKVDIICSIHGMFQQRPNKHLVGDGCPFCGIEQSRSKRVKGLDYYINLSKQVHKDTYDYTTINYTTHNNLKDKVSIICKKHGIFFQSFSDHIYRLAGCPICANENKPFIQCSNVDNFTTQSKSVHNIKCYDYTKVKYVNSRTKVEILCNQHGSFFVTPDNHLNNTSGCPICSLSKGELYISSVFNVLSVNYIHQYTFVDCISKLGRILRFDFFLPDFNIIIEYDGLQHFQPIPFFGGDFSFDKQQENDMIKQDYCNTNNILLYRLPFNLKENEITQRLQIILAHCGLLK